MENSPFHDVFSSLDFLRAPQMAEKEIADEHETVFSEIRRKMFTIIRNSAPKEVKEHVPDSFELFQRQGDRLSEAVRRQIKEPGQRYPFQGGLKDHEDTPENRKEYDAKMSQRKTDIDALAALEEFKKLLDKSDDWTSLDSGKLKKASIKMAKERFGNAVRKSDPFGQFRVRLRRITAMAYDSQGRSYPVQIVEPKED
jgi:hypothetical protein